MVRLALLFVSMLAVHANLRGTQEFPAPDSGSTCVAPQGSCDPVQDRCCQGPGLMTCRLRPTMVKGDEGTAYVCGKEFPEEVNFPRKWISQIPSVPLKVKSAVRTITAVKLIPHCRWAVKRSALGRSRRSMSARPSWTTQANHWKDFAWPKAAAAIPWKTVAAKKVLKVPTWEHSSRGHEVRRVHWVGEAHEAVGFIGTLQLVAYTTLMIRWRYMSPIDDEQFSGRFSGTPTVGSCTNLFWGDKALRTCQLKFFDKPGQHGMAYSCAKEQA